MGRKKQGPAVFYFRPSIGTLATGQSIPVQGSPCECSRLKHSCRSEYRKVCAHPYMRKECTLDPKSECYATVCTRPVGGRGSHHHHKDEYAKVMARLERQLQADGLTYRETQADGTMVYRRD
jgi:hypothetical protein